MKKTIVFLIALLIAFTFAAVEKCTTRDSCNIFSSNEAEVDAKYCDDNKCKPLKQVQWKTANVKPDQICSDSFNIEGDCVKLASEGCTQDFANYVRCLPGLFAIDGKCTKLDPSNTTYVDENEECDESTGKECKLGLQCHRGVCRRQLPEGSVCTTGGIPCQFMHTCDLGKCVKAFSKEEGMPAEHDEACKSGKVRNNICVPASRAPCFTNEDCSDGSVCRREEFESDKPGVCVNLHQYYQREFSSCIASCIASNVGKEEVDCGCEKAQIRMVCSEQCTKRRDQRTYSLLGPVQIDCKALTTIKVESNQCAISEQFLNCDAVYSWSGASSLSFGLLSIITMFIFLF